MIQFPQSIIEAHEHLIAGWDVCPDERTNYYLCEDVLMLIQDNNAKQHLITKYSEIEYNNKLNKVKEYFKLLSITKFFLDIKDNQQLTKDIQQSAKYFDLCVKVQLQIPIILEDLFSMWYEIISNSNLLNSYPKRHQLRPYELKFSQQLRLKVKSDDSRTKFEKQRRYQQEPIT
jgi:hypothetical protein